MGTCNFVTQSDFDLYIYDEDLGNTLDEDEAIAQRDFSMMYTYEESKRLANSLNEQLMFYNIEIRSGYYTGFQTQLVATDWQAQVECFEQLVNEDCHYYFGMCRSKALRKYKAEVKRINKKLLPKFKTELGFEQIKLVGVFSNGEAVYRRVN